MHTYTVLICDDKEAVHESLMSFLNEDGIYVLSAYDMEEAFRLFQSYQVDLMILDVMLPSGDGMDLCRRIRRESEMPIIFLSARTEEFDRIAGLECGGDDYVTKPFSPREMAIRVRKLLTRMSPKDEQPRKKILQYEELRVDEDTMEVFVSNEKYDMTAREVALLAYLIRNKLKVLNREQILNAVWGFDYYGETIAVDAAVKRIRKKLPAEGIHFSIQSIYGVGYRLGGIEP